MKWVLLLALYLAPAIHAQPIAQYVLQIRTRDSVGLNATAPMVGQYEPPLIYSRWLVEIAACTGLPLPTPEHPQPLTFWMVNAGDFQVNDDQDRIIIAHADPPVGRMYVALPYIWLERTIKHEFLHFLLRWKFGQAYNGEHPVEYFGRCEVGLS